MKTIALALCLLLPAATASAQTVYEVPASTAPAKASSALKDVFSDEKPHNWLWWTIGIVLVGGIAAALATRKHGGGPSKGGGY